MSVLPLVLSMLLASDGPSAPSTQPATPATQATLGPAMHEVGFYLMMGGRPEQAITIAVDLLRQDPTDLSAHRLYVLGTSLGLRESVQVQITYEDWVAENPEDQVASVALATLLSHTNRDQGPWCEEMESLLDFEALTQETAYYQHRARFEARKTCPGERESDRRFLGESQGKSGRPLRYSLWIRAQDGAFDAAYLQDLQALQAQGRHMLTALGNPWGEAAQGAALEEVRALLLENAGELAKTEDPVQLHTATKIYRMADDPRAKETGRRQMALDPEWTSSILTSSGPSHWIPEASDLDPSFRQGLSEARYGTDSQRQAIKRLDALEPTVPETGPERALFTRYYADALESTLRFKAAREARLQAWQHNPDSYWVVQELTWNCGAWAEDLVQGLEAATHYLEQPRKFEPRGEERNVSMSAWRLAELQRLAAIHNNRGQIYLEMDEPEQAEADFRRSILLDPIPQASPHLRLGLMLAEQGQEAEALLYLGRGLSLDEPPYPDPIRKATRVAESLYEELRYSPGGFESWVASQSPRGATRTKEGLNYRAGQVLADITLEREGSTQQLSDSEGLRVIDVWATWCGPCIAGFPELNRLAQDYEGQLEVLAVSVDASISDVEHFDKHPRNPAYTVAWAGESGWEELKISSIPTVFLIDGEGTILYYGHSDRALRLAIERALQEPN